MTKYRARPITEGLNRLTSLHDQQRVVVQAKNVFKSVTMLVNGVLFVAAVVVQIMDIVFGANIIRPIVEVFSSDPETATSVVTFMTQVYTALNILLRLKTTQPVTIKTESKE